MSAPKAPSGTSSTTQRPAKVVFVANSDWYLYNFRANLIQQAENEGWQITLICTNGPYISRLRERGWRVIALPLESAGTNPFRETNALAQLARTLRVERPAVVHLFTLKCVLYGCLAAPAVPGAKFIGALTGMGYLFTTTTLKTRALKQCVLRGLSLGLKQAKAELIFQNEFDRQEFVDANLIPAQRTHVIRGSGVDCEQFHPANRTASPNGQLRVLYCGRLLAEKGIHEYLAATAELRAQGYIFESRIAGGPYPGNPSSLSAEEVDQLANDTNHVYLGHYDDMRSLFAQTDLVVLPTYREGTPKALLEAAASGCMIVTTDIPGCQGIVDPGANGYLVEPRQVDPLTTAIKRMLQTTPEEREQMRQHSRRIAIERFSDQHVNSCTLELYDDG